ncbi:hypothetical protein IMCC21906_02660 [Spongiibacter sp. IMCC21906]|nr:hypothetical protein IMCC21906_02660 [Spongiibacter sp. IMCC21906]
MGDQKQKRDFNRYVTITGYSRALRVNGKSNDHWIGGLREQGGDKKVMAAVALRLS